MAGWIVHALRLAGALLSVGGLVWSGVAWIWGGGLAAVFSLLGPPEYAALAVIFSGASVYSGWHFCRPFLPSRRLEAMSEDIANTRRSLAWMVGKSQDLAGHYEEQVRIVARALDEIKVPHPPLTGRNAVESWNGFLIRLQAEARIRNIRCARALWETMQMEQEE